MTDQEFGTLILRLIDEEGLSLANALLVAGEIKTRGWDVVGDHVIINQASE